MQIGCILIANDTLKSINDSAEIDTKCYVIYNILKLASGYIVIYNIIRIIPGTVRLCYFVNNILKLIKYSNRTIYLNS